MATWQYVKTAREEKLLRRGERDALDRGPGIHVPEGGVLIRKGSNRSVQLPAVSRLNRRFFPLSLLVPILLILLAHQTQSSATPKIKTSASPEKKATVSFVMPSVVVTPIQPTAIPTKLPEEIKKVEPIKKGQAKRPKKKLKKRTRRKKNSSESSMFSKARKRIQKVFMTGNFARASRMLEAIARKQGGSLSKSFWKLEAEVAYAKCGVAVRKKVWREAVRQCEKAASKQPHPRAQEILEDLGARAEKSYLEGYVMEGTNSRAARRRYRDALAMAPEGHPYRKKARMKLKSFE